MIRPLIVSLYDYRMTFMQEPSEQLRNGYKMPFMQASAYMAAEEIYLKIDQQAIDPEEAIKQWNQKPSEIKEGKEGKVDYKSRLDELFKSNNRTYYHNREQERSISKEKSEDYRSPPKTEFIPRYPSNPTFSNQQRPYVSAHAKQSGYYSSRYRSDRY